MDYSKIAQVAHRMLTEFGTSGTLTRKTAGAYSPTTGSTSVASASQTISMVASPYPAEHIDGTMIRVGDLQICVAPEGLSFDPEPADTLAYDGKTYTVVNVKSHNPAGTPVLYELQVRR